MILSFSKKFPWGEPTNFQQKILDGEKIHTIRTPRKGDVQWEPGRKIHFATGVRTPDYNCFKEGVCTGVQDIYIQHGFEGKIARVYVDDKLLSWSQSQILCFCDGFENWEQFEKWFDEDFKGKLIHWTDRRY